MSQEKQITKLHCFEISKSKWEKHWEMNSASVGILKSLMGKNVEIRIHNDSDVDEAGNKGHFISKKQLSGLITDIDCVGIEISTGSQVGSRVDFCRGDFNLKHIDNSTVMPNVTTDRIEQIISDDIVYRPTTFWITEPLK